MSTVRNLLLGACAAIVVVAMVQVAASDAGMIENSTANGSGVVGWIVWSAALVGALIPIAMVFRGPAGKTAAFGAGALLLFVLVALVPMSLALAEIDGGLEVLWAPLVIAGEFAIVWAATLFARRRSERGR